MTVQHWPRPCAEALGPGLVSFFNAHAVDGGKPAEYSPALQQMTRFEPTKVGPAKALFAEITLAVCRQRIAKLA